MAEEAWRAPLSTPKFARLAPYFNGVSRADLKRLTEDEIVESFAPTDRLLGRVFVKTHLLEFLNTESPFEEALSDAARKPRPNVIDGRLSLRSAVSTVTVAASPFNLPKAELLSTSILDAALALSGKTASDVTSVDLSACHLFDQDVPHVDALLTRLPNCESVDLSSNRISGATPVVVACVKRWFGSKEASPPGMTVNLCHNTMASIQRLDFFKSLSPDEYGRLIWVPEMWLDAVAGSGWHTFLPPGVSSDVVQGVHNAYYSRKRAPI